MNTLKQKKKIDQKITENKEREIKRLSNEQLQLKNEIEQSKEDYEKIIDHTADQIEDFLKKASSNNHIQ